MRIDRAVSDVQQRLAGFPSPTLLAAYHSCVEVLARCLGGSGSVYFIGNGGSAADCQHLAAELVGRMTADRRPLRGIALTVDSSALTALVNDYDPRDVFVRQVEAFLGPGDVLIAISTSGRSENVVRASARARELGAVVIALTCEGLPPLAQSADLVLAMPAGPTAGTQVLHILTGQALLEDVESALGLLPAVS